MPAPQENPAPARTETPGQEDPKPDNRTIYTVTGPDGRVYSGYEPVYIVCRCGELFGSGAEWQAHFDYHNAYRCSCGGVFKTIGEWEAHAGIYDPVAFIYTGKSREQASSEGHKLLNESSHTADVNTHGGWHSTGYPG